MFIVNIYLVWLLMISLTAFHARKNQIRILKLKRKGIICIYLFLYFLYLIINRECMMRLLFFNLNIHPRIGCLVAANFALNSSFGMMHRDATGPSVTPPIETSIGNHMRCIDSIQYIISDLYRSIDFKYLNLVAWKQKASHFF